MSNKELSGRILPRLLYYEHIVKHGPRALTQDMCYSVSYRLAYAHLVTFKELMTKGENGFTIGKVIIIFNLLAVTRSIIT